MFFYGDFAAEKYKHHSNNNLWSLRYAIFFCTYYRIIPHPLQAPLSTPSCWESRPTLTGKAITFFFFTLLSLSCSTSSLSNDFFLERSLLPSVLFVFEVKSLDLTLELELSLCGDSLKVPRFIRSDSKSVNDLSREGDLDLSLDSDFSLV